MTGKWVPVLPGDASRKIAQRDRNPLQLSHRPLGGWRLARRGPDQVWIGNQSNGHPSDQP